MTHLYVHGPDATFNAGFAKTRIPQGAQVWLYGDNTREIYPPIGWQLTDETTGAAMLNDAVKLIEKREQAGIVGDPLTIVLNDPDDAFLDDNERLVREIIDRGPAYKVQMVVTTRDVVAWLAALVADVVDMSDNEMLASVALELADIQGNALAEQALVSRANVYLLKALLQELRGSRP